MAHEFHYDTVQLYKTQVLGTGSNGTVCRAKCDDLPCAAKILHHALFQFNDPGARRVVQRFQQECDFLSEIRHPHIVQYLGTYGDPEFKLPVLLMELMDESLTQLLERSQEPLPYHTQVDICYNIALALSHLHRNDIIHRDLSSNNVLLTAGSRAKITDFGMARLLDINQSIPMTTCPGTLPYMSPEALDDPPIYAKKLDCFSFGVLTIQIITRRFPDPGPHTKKVRDSRSPTGIMEMPVLETERRKAHIDLINSTHPLLPTATDCLSYSEEDRPSAQELCHHLAALKEAPQYGESLQQTQERSKLAVVDVGQIKELQQEKEELQREKNNHIQSLRQQMEEKDAVIDAKEAEIQQLQHQKLQQAEENKELVLQLAHKDRMTAERERKLQTIIQKLKANEQTTAKLHQTITQKEKTIQDQKNQLAAQDRWIRHLEQQQQAGNSKAVNKRSIQLSWKENAIARAPRDLYRGAAAVDGKVAYFNDIGSRMVYAYDPPRKQWSALPECPQHSFGLVVINDFLTTVGGDSSLNSPTNVLLSLTEEGKERKWSKKFPPMPTKRYCLATMCTRNHLVAAGGKTSYVNSVTVEVMDTKTLQWSVASSLPHPFVWVSATVCGDHVYMLGGSHHGGTTKSVLTCSLAKLLFSCHVVRSGEQPTVWQNIASLPVYHSTCATIHGQLLAVGGCDEDSKSTSAVRKYNPTSDSWEIISHMAIARYKSLVAVLPGSGLIVVGGLTAPFEYVSAVEIANVT